MLDVMGMDKKALEGKLRLVLAHRIGEVLITDQIDRSALLATLQTQN